MLYVFFAINLHVEIQKFHLIYNKLASKQVLNHVSFEFMFIFNRIIKSCFP